jgi:hypothetical protein
MGSFNSMAFNSNPNPKEFNLYASNHNSSISPSNKELNAASPKNKIMRVIRGGGGKDYNYNSNQNFFFNKMLNGNNIETLGGKIKSDGKKINLDKLKKEKYEQEMKYLDNEDLNNSKESEILEVVTETKRAKTPTKDGKNGFFNFFTKIIK